MVTDEKWTLYNPNVRTQGNSCTCIKKRVTSWKSNTLCFDRVLSMFPIIKCWIIIKQLIQRYIYPTSHQVRFGTEYVWGGGTNQDSSKAVKKMQFIQRYYHHLKVSHEYVASPPKNQHWSVETVCSPCKTIQDHMLQNSQRKRSCLWIWKHYFIHLTLTT